MLKNSIVNDNNIVNICFKVKAKKDYGEMRAKRAENFRNFRLRGGDNPLMGVGPPPPYWKTLVKISVLYLASNQT